MDSPNSGSLLFLAFWEMPAMDSPSTCRTHHTLIMENHCGDSHSAPRIRVHCVSLVGEETPFPLFTYPSQALPVLPQTCIQGLPWSSP